MRSSLAAISMWRPNLASDSGLSEATEPVFVPPEPTPDHPGNKPDELPELPPPDDSPEDSDNWFTFERKLYPQGTKPNKLKIGDSPEEIVKNWRDVILKVASWLAREGILSANDCPIGAEKYTFISREAVNPDGTPFKNPEPLSNGLILQRGGYANTITQWHKLRQLLDQLGVDKNTIKVRYD